MNIKRGIYTVIAMRNAIKTSSHGIPARKYIIHAIMSRVIEIITIMSTKCKDPYFLEDINYKDICHDFKNKESQTTEFWSTLSKYFLAYCNEKDFRNFKRTINRRFFNFPSNVNSESVEYFYKKIKRNDKLGLLSIIKESEIGNPRYFSVDGNHFLTWDLLHSINEFYNIYPFLKGEKWKIIEIGPGYGRLAFLFAKVAEILNLPKLHYTIVDIPPTLAVCSKYFSLISNELPLLDIKYYEKNRGASTNNRNPRNHTIEFILPHQFETISDSYYNACFNISSFHEMPAEVIKKYFDLIDHKLMRGGVLYTKQWGDNADDLTKYNFTSLNSYPYKKHWNKCIDRPAEPPFFFEAIFRNDK